MSESLIRNLRFGSSGTGPLPLPATQESYAMGGREREQRYLIALGSNVPHRRHGRPAQVLRAALAALRQAGVTVEDAAPIIASRPLGPSLRTYANSAALIRTPLEPPALLDLLKSVERGFGRRSGQRWASRVLDLDMVLWQGGGRDRMWASAGLIIPHPAFRERAFVLGPAAAIAPRWRDPLTGLTLRHLLRRLRRAHRLDPGHPAP